MKIVNRVSIGMIVAGVIGFLVTGGQASGIEQYVSIGITAAGTVGVLYALIKGLITKEQ